MPGYWNTDDQGGGQAPPSYPVSQPSGGHPGGWVSEPSQTFSTPPQVTTPVSTGTPNFQAPQVTTPIIDVAANQDAIDDAAAIAAANQNPPESSGPYVPDWGENYVNVSQVGGGVNTPGSLLYGMNLEDYFGPGANKWEQLPQEFLQSLGQGVVVGGADKVANDALGPGFSGDPQTPQEEQAWNESVASGWDPNVGTWGQVEGQWNFGDPHGLLEGSMTPENYEKYLWNFNPKNPNQIKPDESLSHPFFSGGQESFYDMMDEDWGQTYTPGGGGYGSSGWDWGDLLAERRARQEELFYGPKISPQKQMEQQGFFNTLGSKIRNPFLEAVGETLAINPEGRSGLYGKTMFHPKMRKPWGLEKEYATGARTPLYENRARGGIMSAWENRR